MWVTYLLVFLGTLKRRTEPHIYVANWFYLAFILTIAVLHLGNNAAIPVSLFSPKSYIVWSGVQDAMVQWWYGHNAVGFFLTAGFLAIMYYFIPKRAERPVYSYRLSIIHFWALIFLYIWAGPHHLHYTALPDWAQTLGMTFSIMLWMPSWGGMINGLMTLVGRVGQVAHRSGAAHDGGVGRLLRHGDFRGPADVGEGRQLAVALHRLDHRPRAFRRARLGRLTSRSARSTAWCRGCGIASGLYSLKLVNWHFWISTIGIVLYISAMWVSGILQGLMWRAYTRLGFLEYSFIETVEAMHPFYVIRALGGALFLAGALIMVWNLWKTVNDGRPPSRLRRALRCRRSERTSCRFWPKHAIFEKNSIVLLIGILIVIAIGGLVEIAPLFYLKSTIEKVGGVRPYTPLELGGPQHLCPRGLLQLPLADDPAAARRGRALRPLFARRREHVRPAVPVGLEAHRARSRPRRRQVFRRLAPRSPGESAQRSCRASVMPGYPLLAATELDFRAYRRRPEGAGALGVPYTAEMIATAAKPIVDPGDDRIIAGADACAKRYPKAQSRDFDGNPSASPKPMR